MVWVCTGINLLRRHPLTNFIASLTAVHASHAALNLEVKATPAAVASPPCGPDNGLTVQNCVDCFEYDADGCKYSSAYGVPVN
jgi:hypothetical protein